MKLMTVVGRHHFVYDSISQSYPNGIVRGGFSRIRNVWVRKVSFDYSLAGKRYLCKIDESMLNS